MVKFHDEDLLYFIIDQIGILHLMEIVKKYCDHKAKIAEHQYEDAQAMTMKGISIIIEETFLVKRK